MSLLAVPFAPTGNDTLVATNRQKLNKYTKCYFHPDTYLRVKHYNVSTIYLILYIHNSYELIKLALSLLNVIVSH